MNSPGLPLAVNPQPGAVVMFKYRGEWVRGVVCGYGDALRLPLHRLVGAKPGRVTHRRNRSQIYDPSRAAEPTGLK